MLDNDIKKEIENAILLLEEDNDFMIDSFLERTNTRIINAFSQNKITINKSVIQNITEENIKNILHDINKESCNKIKKMLEKIYLNLYEQIKNNKISKKELKELINTVIQKIKQSNNTSLTPVLFNNYIDCINSKIAIYDNINLNKLIRDILEKSPKEIINTINENNNELIINEIMHFLKKLLQ
ncbi:MAG: hypothetical protein IJB83_04345 [Bacilli bacterium]|nr:hypothetical protein [Bacilli bacterium]